MKLERLYDLSCYRCGKHISTDYHTGMFSTSKAAVAAAKMIGFRTSKGENICPECNGVIFQYNGVSYRITKTDGDIYIQKKAKGQWEKPLCYGRRDGALSKKELREWGIREVQIWERK